MKRGLRVLATAGSLSLALCAADAAYAQKQGGILRMSHFDSPASMSLHEEATVAANRPMMGVFNNLVMYKQDVPQNSLQSIVPDLAISWSWNEEGTELTFPLRQGVKWHDGKPFTAKDVKCTWDLLTGKVEREAAHQSAQILVQKPRRGDRQRRLRGHFPSEAAATLVSGVAGFGLVAGLSLPRAGARDAAATRSAPAPSNSSNSSRTNSSR